MNPTNSIYDRLAFFDIGAFEIAPKSKKKIPWKERLFEVAVTMDSLKSVNTLIDKHKVVPKVRHLIHVLTMKKVSIEIFKRLAQNVEDVNEKDEFGKRPLDLAIEYGNIKFCKILLDNGADLNLVKQDCFTCLTKEMNLLLNMRFINNNLTQTYNSIFRLFIYEPIGSK